MHMNISQKQSYARIYSKNNISQAAFYARIYTKKNAAEPGGAHFVRSGNRNAHGHLTSAILRENCQEKCRGPRLRQTRYPDFVQACRVDMDMDISLTRTILCKRLCMSLRNRNAHKHFTRAITCEN